MQYNNSILPPQIRGVVKVSGYRGRGKTSTLIGADRPSNIAFLDFEHKGAGFHSQLNFGFYCDMVAGTSGPLELFHKVNRVIDELPQDKFPVVILDNGSPLELALSAGARLDLGNLCQEYDINYKNAVSGSFGGVKPIVNFFISNLICSRLFGKGVQMIGVTHHISARWGSGGPIPNKKRVKGYDRWMELAILSLVIVDQGDHPPTPSAMVEKEQLSVLRFNEEKGEYEQQVRCLPVRLPRCTFPAIKEYLVSPADLQNPAPGEAIVQSEFDIFSERLDREQIALMRLSLESEQRKARESSSAELELEDAKTKQVRELLAVSPSMSLPAIAQKAGMTVPQILKIKGSI